MQMQRMPNGRTVRLAMLPAGRAESGFSSSPDNEAKKRSACVPRSLFGLQTNPRKTQTQSELQPLCLT